MCTTAGPAGLVTRLRAAGCVYAEDEARLLVEAAPDAAELEVLAARRVAGEPLEHLLGWAEFCGLRVRVAPSVFVPRRRTELLVRVAAESLRPGDVVLDLCCGSGAVAAALLAGVPEADVHAADIDPAAVACARLNLPAERVHLGDLYAAVPDGLRGRVAVLTANAPYVPSDRIATMPSEARDHEARVALDGGHDGLDVQRALIAGAPAWLARGGRVLVETSRSQAPLTLASMRTAGLEVDLRQDPDIDATIAVGRSPG
jgi:release factor glutamine methyltransferase